MRELGSSGPRNEKASSSSAAAALTLALSSGRRDSFSSRAKVVPEVMLLPSRLGGLVPSSELESARCDSSDPSLARTLDLSTRPDALPLTTRLGALVAGRTSFNPSAIASGLSVSGEIALLAEVGSTPEVVAEPLGMVGCWGMTGAIGLDAAGLSGRVWPAAGRAVELAEAFSFAADAAAI